MLTLKDFWTVIDHATRVPVVPSDCNPGSSDEGFIVYRSKRAAELAAEHQSELYELDCQACRLDLACFGSIQEKF
jgi:hypothetical protein